ILTCALLFSHLYVFNNTATTDIYTLSLHDALPISSHTEFFTIASGVPSIKYASTTAISAKNLSSCNSFFLPSNFNTQYVVISERSEEHTSELQSRVDLVCRLLLEKKKKSPSICYTA